VLEDDKTKTTGHYRLWGTKYYNVFHLIWCRYFFVWEVRKIREGEMNRNSLLGKIILHCATENRQYKGDIVIAIYQGRQLFMHSHNWKTSVKCPKHIFQQSSVHSLFSNLIEKFRKKWQNRPHLQRYYQISDGQRKSYGIRHPDAQSLHFFTSLFFFC